MLQIELSGYNGGLSRLLVELSLQLEMSAPQVVSLDKGTLTLCCRRAERQSSMFVMSPSAMI